MSNSLTEVYRAIADSKFNQSIGGGDPAEAGDRQSDILVGLEGLTGAATILDYGCGIGRTMPALYSKLPGAGVQLDGCDISEDFVEECKKIYGQYNFRFFKISAQNQHYEQFRTTQAADEMPVAYYDFVYSFSVFTHFDATMAANTLNFVRNLTKPGGRYYFTLFRIDEQSSPVLAQNTSPAFKFQAPFKEGDAEYFAVPSDKFAFAAIAQSRIEYEIARAGWKVCTFQPGHWRGLMASNIHDAYLIQKI